MKIIRLKLVSFMMALSFLAVFVGYQNCAKVQFSANRDGAENTNETVTKVLSLGLMTKNMACVMCHTDINGNISGFGTLTFRNDSSGNIWGNIYGADQKLQTWIQSGGNFILNPSVHDTTTDANLVANVLPELISSNLDGTNGQYTVKAGEEHNKFSAITFHGGGGLYTLTHPDPSKREEAQKNLVVNPFLDRPIIHEQDFPALDINQCKQIAQGFITTANGTVLHSPINSNLILINGQSLGSQVSAAASSDQYNNFDSNCPPATTLTVSGEVVVEGDLVLAGCIKGKGSIYATGNIYVPDDIKNVNSAFPYALTVDDNLHKSEALDRVDRDMISLGAGEFIVMGIIRTEVIAHEEQDPIFKNNLTSLKRLYNWIASTGGQSVYENSFLKRAYFAIDSASGQKRKGSVALVEANLYANKGVAITLTSLWGSNIVINGSIITPNLSMLSTGASHSHYSLTGQALSINPFNSVNFNNSQLNQDYRLRYTNKGYECHRVRTY